MGKVTATEFQNKYSDFEYIYLTVIGFGKLHLYGHEIVEKNNGQSFMTNPGAQMLEHICGMTMHADRAGANFLLRSAPAVLVKAFTIAKNLPGRSILNFFKTAFDRTADPCLEGRTERLLEYIEKNSAAVDLPSLSVPPWEDVSLKSLPKGTSLREVVGEHLRVFMNECTWNFSRELGIPYEDAKIRRLDTEHAATFTNTYNAVLFEKALLARGGLVTADRQQWDVCLGGGKWSPYTEDVCALCDAAYVRGSSMVTVRLGPQGWKYEVHLDRMVQRNPKTGAERQIRSRRVSSGCSLEDVRDAIRYFVELETLPP